jgi:predicted MFS family arabinose efflux permease
VPVLRVQPVLDNDAAASGRTGLSHDAERYRAVRARRRLRSIAAPVAGRLADRGWSRPATGAAIVLVLAAFLGILLSEPGSWGALALLVAAAIAIDFGVQANLVLGFRAIFALAPDARGRLNGVYLASLFAAGAAGSAAGAWAYERGGWKFACCIGAAPPFVALTRFLFRVATGRA